MLLGGCATQEPEFLSSESPRQEPQPSEQTEGTSRPEPLISIEELTALTKKVPEPDLESLREHFRLIDKGAQSLEAFPIEYQIGPTAVPEKVELVMGRFSEKLKMYQLVGLRSLNQDWVLASENDYQWWLDYRSSQDPDYPIELWNTELNELGHCRLSPAIFCGAGNFVNGKNYQDNVIGTRFIDRGLEYVTRHEATHFYQAVFGYGGRCWFAEGQATFFETYLETSSRSRLQVIGDLRQSPANLAEASEQELYDLISSDMVCNNDSNVAYELGMLAFEYLYMNFSFSQVHELMVLSSQMTWDDALVAALGANPQELNRDLAGYIYAQIGQ